jgi:hypothetical protein
MMLNDLGKPQEKLHKSLGENIQAGKWNLTFNSSVPWMALMDLPPVLMDLNKGLSGLKRH